MQIGIDARSLLGTPTGVGRYLANVLSRLARLDARNEYCLYFDRPVDKPVLDGGRFRQKHLSLPFAQNALTWSQLRLPGELLLRPPSLVHFPYHTIPFVRNYRSVVSIHDITYEVRPDWYPWKGGTLMRVLTRYAATHADAILTCSNASKADICRYYRVPEQKVRVTYYAVEDRFRKAGDAALAAIRAKYKIGRGKCVLYVGTIHDRRNIEQLLRAYHAVRRRVPESQLVLVGKREYLTVDLDALVSELGIGPYVSFPSYISDEDLPALYSAADLFVYPSSYEGFGFPPVEAMACGVPVVTGRNSSLLEVAADAALLVEPRNVDEMADAMLQILESDRLAAELSRKGLAQAAKFSWDRTAAQTLEVYRSLGAA